MNLKRKALIFSFALLTAVSGVVAREKAKDPMVVLVEGLHAKGDQVFKLALKTSVETTDPKTQVKRFLNAFVNVGSDQIVGLRDPRYSVLFEQFRIVKKELEAASVDRQYGAIGKDRLMGIALASRMYLEEEKRLYRNLYRNFHEKKQGTLPDEAAIDSLNLRLQNNTALTLLSDDVKFKARYELRHPSDASPSQNQIEYGLSAQDRSILEEEALKLQNNELGYAKLVQFLTIRERLNNQWALDRLNPQGEMEPAIAAQDQTFFSFRSHQGETYYSSLWADDHLAEFQKIESDLFEKSLRTSLISSTELGDLLKNYFQQWPEYQAVVTAGIDHLPENYFVEAPKQLLEGIEKKWNQNRHLVFQDANLSADAYDSHSISKRLADAVIYYQRKYLIDALVNEATPRIPAVRTAPDAARALAEKQVDAVLVQGERGGPNRLSLASLRLKGSFQKVIEDARGASEMMELRESRFQEHYDKLSIPMKQVARSLWLKKDIENVVNAQKSKWKKDALYIAYGFGSQEHQLAHIPARPYLKDSVHLFTPDQLSEFYSKKIEFYDGRFNTQGVSKVIEKIEKDVLVRKGMKRFFQLLSDEFYRAVFEKHLNLEQVDEINSPLYEILPAVAAQSFEEYQAQFKKPKVPKAEVMERGELKQKLIGSLQKPVSDHPLQLKRPLELKKVEPKLPVSLSEREVEIDLFVQAMSVMNLGTLVSGPTHLIKKRFDLATGRPSISLSLSSPSDVEAVLLMSGKAEQKLKDRLVSSLLDQKIAAEVISESFLLQFPFLALHETNDLESPTFASRLGEYYTPRQGLNAEAVKKLMRPAIEKASLNQKGLVEEAFRAEPGHYQDAAFKNIFLAAPQIRELLQSENKNYQSFDQAIVKGLRSQWQKFNDAIDPWTGALGLLLGIAAIYFFAPLVLSGITWMSATGATGFGGFMAGFGPAMAESITAGGIKGICASLLVGKASFLLGAAFIVQAAVHYQIHCIELPKQLQYELRVVQAQLGMSNKAPILHTDLEKFSSEIHSAKVSTYIEIGMNALIVPHLISSGVSAIKTASGLAVSEAINRSTTLETVELSQSIRQASLKTLIREENSVLTGTTRYLKQKMGSLAQIGRVNTLSASASSEDIRMILQSQMSEFFQADPSALRSLYETRLDYLEKEGLNITKRIEALAGQDLLLIESGTGQIRPSQSLKAWVKNLLLKHRVESLPYGRILMSEDAFHSVKMEGFLPGAESHSKKLALILFSYAKDLQAETEYYRGLSNAFELLSDSGELSGASLLKRHFEVLGDADWARHEDLLRWFGSQKQYVNTPLAARFKLTRHAETEALGRMQQAFKDYHVLRGENELIQSRFWAQKTDAYFSESKSKAGEAFEFNAPNAKQSQNLIELFVPLDSF